jgi:tetratricopeptide (TPR) repeat protein
MTFVLDISVRMVVAALAVAAVLRVMRVNTAAVRHAAWTAVLGAMLLMPLLPSVVPAVPMPSVASIARVERVEWLPESLPDIASARTPAPAPATVTPRGSYEQVHPPTPDARASQEPPHRWILFAVATVYVAGLSLFLGRLLHGWRLVSRMIGRATRCGSGLLCESSEVAVPLTAGVIRPVIVLPQSWREWPSDTLDAVVAHETAHVRRRDPLIALLARVNRAIFWFHPLAWWLDRQLAVTAEHACDEAAARTVAEPRRYAEILVEMADLVRRNQGRIVWQAVGVNGAGLLQGRIERVLRGTGGRMSRMKVWGTLLACGAAILLVVACRQQVTAAPLKEDPELAKQLVEQDQNIKQFEASRDMTQAQADALEKKLEANPQDFDARKQLVTYYRTSSTVAWDKKVPGLRRHALWLIEHHPEHKVVAPPLSPQYDPEGFAAAKTLWEAHLTKTDASPFVVYRAAQFFAPSDKPYAERLILRGMQMDPESTALRTRMEPNVSGYQWDSQLAQLYAAALLASERVSGTYNDLRSRLEQSQGPYVTEVRQKLANSKDARLLARVGNNVAWLAMRSGGPKEDPTQKEFREARYQEGLGYLRRALEIDPNLELAKTTLFRMESGESMNEAERLANRAHEKFMISEDITEYAKKDPTKAKNEREEAKKQAEQVLEMAKAHSGDPSYSVAVMTAHQVLSAIALRDGDRERAVAHLLESTKVPPADALRYGQPFAWPRPVNALLKAGERERIVQFFEALAPLLGTQSRDDILGHAKAIREGRMPSTYQRAAYRETAPSPFKPMR